MGIGRGMMLTSSALLGGISVYLSTARVCNRVWVYSLNMVLPIVVVSTEQPRVTDTLKAV
jgi:hypothetical protein